MSSDKIYYTRHEITEEDKAAVLAALSDNLTQGPQVALFEKDFAQKVGAPYAVAVNNGTSALQMAVWGLGLQPGQKVLCPSNTFVASSNCVLYAGAQVEFVDLDPRTLCLDLNQVEDHLKASKDIKGLIYVDFAGLPVVGSEIRQLADRYGIWTLEDACHALGAQYQVQGQWHSVGNGQHAAASVFSFHPAKHITTGEGGMVTTADKKLYEKFLKFRSHGITRKPEEFEKTDGDWYYEMQVLGYNLRIPDLLCALGLSQLKRLSSNIEKRQAIAAKYHQALSGLPIQMIQVPESSRHAYHLFVVQVEERKKVYDYLKAQNIFAQVHYIPIHTQPFYRKKFPGLSLPQTEAYYQGALSLPMYHSLRPEDQDRVISAVKAFYA